MINFAIVGCGRISGKHIEAIEKTTANVIAICDPNREALQNAKSAIRGNKDVVFYGGYSDVLKDKAVQVVSLCTPSGLHSEMTIEAAKAGKHVIVEKPMALTVRDAYEMINACKDNSVQLFVVKQNRYNPPIQELKKAIDEGRFGKIYTAEANVKWARDQRYYDQADWRGKVASDGGVLFNQTSHHLDMLRFLVGELDTVFCKKETFGHKIEAEDTAVGLLIFKNGAIGTYYGTTCAATDLEGSVTIVGEKGTVKVGGFAMNEMVTWYFRDPIVDDVRIMQTAVRPPNVYGHGHQPFYKDVVEALKNNQGPKINGYDAAESVRLVVGLLKSAKEGRPVRLEEIANDDNSYYY
ncbi:Gfo/Idh/MocA family oxidoreductase [Candidatus Woesearchaeota archaeon]|nr:Gfo/Idh/MocA family oxidoreductase [Candidatus Woesearchaeota archaeon]